MAVEMTRRGRGLLIALPLVILWVPCSALAEDDMGSTTEHDERSGGEEKDDISPSGETMNRTVVTPTRADGTVFDSDRTIHVTTREEIARSQPSDIPELVDQFPGAFNQRTNRAAGAPVLRGFVGPSNLLLIDGVRMNTSIFRTGPNQYASLTDPLGLDHVELVLGPGSVLYGSNAMGGVLHSITRSVPTREGWSGTILSRLASADRSTEGSVHLAGRRGSVMGWAGGSLRRHGDLRIGGGESLARSDYLHVDWRGRVAVALGQRWTLTNTYLGTDVGDGVRTDRLALGDLRFYGNTQHLAYSELRRRGRGTLRDLRLTASFLRLEDRVDRYSCDTSGGPAACLALQDGVVSRKRRYDDAVNALGLSTVGVLGWFDDTLRLTAGVDGRMEQVASALVDARADDGFSPIQQERGNFSTGSSYSTADAFGVLDGLIWRSPGRVDLRASGGIRVSQVRARAPDVPGLGDGGASAEVTYAHTGLAASAGLRALVLNRYNFYGSWAQGFRSPNLQETTVLGNTGSFFEIPNAELGPERSDTFEVGLRAHTRTIRFRAAGFLTVVGDAIARAPSQWQGQDEVDGAEVRMNVNANRATYRGIELGAEAPLKGGVVLFAQGAWVRGDTEDDGVEEPTRRIPPLTAAGGVRWRIDWNDLRVSLYGRGATTQDRLHGDDRKDLRICEDPSNPGQTMGAACSGTPGWTTVHASVGLRVPSVSGLRVNLQVDNLLDARYRSHGSGFDAPGFNAKLSAYLDF